MGPTKEMPMEIMKKSGVIVLANNLDIIFAFLQASINKTIMSTCIPPRETHEKTCSSLVRRVQYDSNLESVILIQDLSEKRK